MTCSLCGVRVYGSIYLNFLIFHFDEENEFSTILDFEFESKT